MAKSKSKITKDAVSQPLEHCVYVGPNVPGGALCAFQTFKGGFPAHVQEILDRTPAMKTLFVPVGDLAGARMKLKDPRTILAQTYKATVKSLAGKEGV